MSEIKRVSSVQAIKAVFFPTAEKVDVSEFKALKAQCENPPTHGDSWPAFLSGCAKFLTDSTGIPHEVEYTDQDGSKHVVS